MIYPSTERPPWPKLFIYGFQGVAMTTYSIIWGLFVGLGLNLTETQLAIFTTATIFTIGLAILAQAWAGHRMGLISGPNIVPGFVMITAVEAGVPLGELFGGFIIGAALAILFGLSGLANYLQRYFTPLAMGTLVMMIGLGTASIGVSFMAQLGVSFLLFALVLGLGVGYISYTLSGFVSTISVLIVVVIGYLVAIMTGNFDWSLVERFALLVPPQPIVFGLAWPRLSILLAAVIAMVVSSFQEIVHVSASAEVAQESLESDRVRPITAVFGLAEGIIPSLLSVTPLVTYSVNVGFLAATRVASRYPMILTGLMLMLIGLLGPVAGFLAAMPRFIAGAILLGVAGTAIGIGAKLWRTGTPQFSDTDAFIVGFSVFLALGWQALPPERVAQFPDWVSQIFGNPIIAAFIYVVFLEQLVFRRRSMDR